MSKKPLEVVGWLSTSGHQTIINEKARKEALAKVKNKCSETKSGCHEIRDVDKWGWPSTPWCARCGLEFPAVEEQ